MPNQTNDDDGCAKFMWQLVGLLFLAMLYFFLLLFGQQQIN